SADPAIQDKARAPAAIKLLWEVCQIPDYRKISSANHAELAGTLYKFLIGDPGLIPEDWFAGQVALADRTDGDLDTLSNRIAHIRTWTFVSNRSGWLADADHWRERTRAIEDTLSDALHELLTQRFVDRRTSVLMKSMRDKDTLYADIENTGQIFVEKHYVGKLDGFRFTPDTAAAGVHGKAARHAAAKVLAVELTNRAGRLVDAKDEKFKLERSGAVTWEGQEIGRLEASEDPLRPAFALIADEHLHASDKERIASRVNDWLGRLVELRLKPLIELSKAPDLTGLARGIAFRLVESFGILPRETAAEEIRALDQQARAELRKYGVRFGAYNIYFPLLLKPAASDLLLLLWALKHGAGVGVDPANLPVPPRQGLTSVPVEKSVPEVFYRAAGFHVCGSRAVRVDMLERLADLIRPLTSWKPTTERPEPPSGAVGRGGFRVQPEMLSIIGCSAEEMGNVLFALGFRKERRPVQPKPAAAEAPAAESVVEGAAEAGATAEPVADTQAAEKVEIAADALPDASEVAAAMTEEAPEPVLQANAEVAAEEIQPAAMETADVLSAEPTADDVSAETESVATAEAVADAESAPAAEAASATESVAAAEVASETEGVSAGEVTAAADGEAAAAAEPELEEIWRPRRRVQGDERRQNRRRPGHGQGHHQQRERRGHGAPQHQQPAD
ncbi:MAG TPA: helicase, partial [Hyphomicrobiales bacterium]